METNIKESFDYISEEAKTEFQANVTSLLEIHSQLTTKLQQAREKGKDVIFLTADEVDVFQNWILTISSSLMENYSLIDHTNRITNRLYQACTKAEAHRKRLPKLKDIAA